MIHARECVLQSLQICCIIPRLALRSNSHPALGASLTNLTTSWSVTRSTPTVLICLRIPPPLTHAPPLPPPLRVTSLSQKLLSPSRTLQAEQTTEQTGTCSWQAVSLQISSHQKPEHAGWLCCTFFLVGGAFTEAGKTLHTHTLTWKPRHLSPLVIKWFHSATVMHTVHFH